MDTDLPAERAAGAGTSSSLDLPAALARIAQLEAELHNSEARLQQALSKGEGDVISALQSLQENWQAQFGRLSLKDLYERVDVLVPVRKRQLFCTALVFLMPLLCMCFTMYLAYLSFWSATVAVFLISYLAFIKYDDAPSNGSRQINWIKKHWLWTLSAQYFPILLRKANSDTCFDPKHTYLFGYHPHGIISVGGFLSFGADGTGFSQLFPGINVHGATLQGNFLVPFFREILLSIGAIGVSARSIKAVLSKGSGNAVLVVPGGAAEALDAKPGVHDLTLQRRSGFFRIALEHGVHLVPIYSFGENYLYEQIQNERGSFIRECQETIIRLFGVSTPCCFGCGSACFPMIPYNPIPRRHPIITVVGDPISCPKIENPTEEDINNLRVLYIGKLKEIFDRFADTYDKNRKGPLRIVK